MTTPLAARVALDASSPHMNLPPETGTSFLEGIAMNAADPVAFADLTPRTTCPWERAQKLFANVEHASNGLSTLGELLKAVDPSNVDDEFAYEGLGGLLAVIAEGLNRYAEVGYTLPSPRKPSCGSPCPSGSACAAAMPPGQKLPST